MYALLLFRVWWVWDKKIMERHVDKLSAETIGLHTLR